MRGHKVAVGGDTNAAGEPMWFSGAERALGLSFPESRERLTAIAAPPARVGTGRVFTQEDGAMLHPANVTRRFIDLHEEIGLPPIRLHDLRHGATTLPHAAEADRAIAGAAARLVPRARRAGDAEKTQAGPKAADGVKSGAEEMPPDTGESAARPDPGDAPAHTPLTQTASDTKPEAE